MLGNNGSCLKYLQDLFTAIKSFYHPSNTGKFQQDLITFLSKLAQAFVDRIHLLVVLKNKKNRLMKIDFLENVKRIRFGTLFHHKNID